MKSPDGLLGKTVLAVTTTEPDLMLSERTPVTRSGAFTVE